ncbi:MAG: tetratricopeptide repeat-containing protein [Desulfovibrio sp.]|jgi:tetratricopeptide (TPR) repeat protein|nr:tetratricopeptide repeat-containing protein [Desulfovibrio sp.]
MKQKIEWYREVLELEPGSRVFFPLAKLLAADRQTEDAVAVLRQGLLRHPDHVEARLLLVELLHMQRSDKELSTEIDGLEHLFAAYPGFWSAWSESISADPAMQDAALAMRFFAAALQGKDIGWGRIIEHGLHAVLADGAAGVLPEKRAPDTEPTPPPERSGGVTGTGGGSDPASLSGSREIRALLSSPAQEDEQEESAGADDYEDADEGFSLRTRSMAEVLAEQGDFSGALDIYRELLQSALPGDRPSLEARVEELTHCMAGAADQAGREEKGSAFAGESSKIVNLFESLSLVESLAERLEARAR